MTYERRAEAARRVRAAYPPLPEIFAALRATLAATADPAPPAPPAAVPPDAAPEPAAAPPPDAAPEPEPAGAPPGDAAPAPPAGAPPAPDLPPAPDPLGVALHAAARDATGTPDDVALTLALALEEPLTAAVRAGARAAADAGVPTHGAVRLDRAVDSALPALAPYAALVAAADDPPPPDPELLARLRGMARSAGVVEAVRGTGWSAVQRFGDPWCPRSACYGRNGSLITDERVAAEGFPPYGDGCNCVAEPADLP